MSRTNRSTYSFYVVPSDGAHALTLGARRAIDDADALRIAIIELKNEQSRHGLTLGAQIVIRRSDGSVSGTFNCMELLEAASADVSAPSKVV